MIDFKAAALAARERAVEQREHEVREGERALLIQFVGNRADYERLMLEFGHSQMWDTFKRTERSVLRQGWCCRLHRWIHDVVGGHRDKTG